MRGGLSGQRDLIAHIGRFFVRAHGSAGNAFVRRDRILDRNELRFNRYIAVRHGKLKYVFLIQIAQIDIAQRGVFRQDARIAADETVTVARNSIDLYQLVGCVGEDELFAGVYVAHSGIIRRADIVNRHVILQREIDLAVFQLRRSE